MREHLTLAAVPSLERQQVLAALGSSGRGLSADEAAARRAETGANQLPAARRRPVLAEFGAQFANMFAVVLMVAAGITFGAYALSTPRDSASLVLAIGILGVVLLKCESRLAVVPGATHMCDEPGALGQVTDLTSGWFARHFARMSNIAAAA